MPSKYQKRCLSTTLGVIAAFFLIQSPSFDDLQVFHDKTVTAHSKSYHRLLRTFGASEELEEWIDNLELGWGSPPAEWIKDLCPEVVNHFNHFPSTKLSAPTALEFLPFLPTEHAAEVVCTMKVMKSVAASLNAQFYLHAGSHLGAVVHGQMIPWDDDVDGFMDYRKKDELEKICEGDGVEVHSSGVRFKCVQGFNALKIWLHYPGKEKLTEDSRDWYSPFLDLFFYEIKDGNIWEVSPKGNRLKQYYAIEDYFPTRPYYFAGIHLLGPQSQIAKSRYDSEVCRMGGYNHRIERGVRQPVIHNALDCDKLSKRFPFKTKSQDIVRIKDEPYFVQLFPSKATEMKTIVIPSPSIKEREKWFKKPDSKGQALSDAIKHLNKMEIDNSISPQFACTGPLKVVELNAERGRWWMESASLLKDADVIILNEMDIGMARSDNQHTTRLLAHFLGMNYAWGLEFVELTAGTKEDRYNANGVPDFNGLHGNAFLTKCIISDPKIFRNKVGSYFSSEAKGFNANGLEKRLGGRMGMFGRIIVDGKETVIGSVHKMEGFEREVKEYIGKRDSIIAGDQPVNYCARVDLQNIVSIPIQNTWPASCKGFGSQRGDIMCSNMNVSVEEVTIKPCVTNFAFSMEIGDHALVSASLNGVGV